MERPWESSTGLEKEEENTDQDPVDEDLPETTLLTTDTEEEDERKAGRLQLPYLLCETMS